VYILPYMSLLRLQECIIQYFFLLVCYLDIQLILCLVFDIKGLLMICLSSANSSLSAGSSERVTVETSSWTIAEICSVSDQWAATADSTNCTTFAGWTALFTTISHQHGEWCHWLPTWLLSSVSARAPICPSTKLTTCLCQPRLRMGVGSFLCLCGMVPTHRMYPHKGTITEHLLSALSFLSSSLFVHWLYITPVVKHVLKFQ
jgi:hypothetical protein